MIDVRREFPGIQSRGWFNAPSYSELVSKIGKIEIEARDNDYQGDSFFLLSKYDKVGYLSFSWGSCSGCDALQACDGYQDLQKLMDELESKTIWFDSIRQMQEWVNHRDWESTIDWHSGAKKFIKEFREYHLRAFK